MQAMAPFFKVISELEGFENVVFWLGLFVFSLIAGFITDNIMGRTGFGPFWNAVLVLGGVFGGVYLRYNYFLHAPYYSYEPYLTLGLCLGVPALLLIVLGIVHMKLG